MDREKLAMAALQPLDLALGGIYGLLDTLNSVDRVAVPVEGLARSVMRRLQEWSNDLEIVGAENVPTEGGVVLASNHQSWLDVGVISSSCPRRVRFLAKSEFVDWPVMRRLIALTRTPTIRRGGDEAGLARAVAMLTEGAVLGVFPEGTIPGEERVGRHEVDPATGLLRGKTGAVRLAAAAGVPVVPVGVSGTGAALPPEVYPRLDLLEPPRPARITVRFGAPLTFPATTSHDELRAATDELMAAISALVDHRRGFVPIRVPAEPLPRFRRLGVLLLHGFTGAPSSLASLIPELDAAGVPCRLPLLAGHGTHPAALAGVVASDWLADAERELKNLVGCDAVVAVGVGSGALLALDLALRHPDRVAGVCALAPALRYRDVRTPLAPLLSRFFESWPAPSAEERVDRARQSYPRFMLSAFLSLRDYVADLAARLQGLEAPLAVLQGRQDRVVNPISAIELYRGVASAHRELHWLERSGHELLQDAEAAEVRAKVLAFVGRFRV